MVSRRSVVFGGLSAALAACIVRPARASLAEALTLNQLVHQSRHAFVGTPVDQFGRWETIGRRSRIVTYTLVRNDYSFDGRPTPTAEVMVRTLGGAVDDIGQVVAGEAQLRKGATGALFVEPASQDLFVVTAMGQGHYPLFPDSAGVKRFRAPMGQLELWGMTPDAAVKRLDGRTVNEAEAFVAEELARGAR